MIATYLAPTFGGGFAAPSSSSGPDARVPAWVHPAAGPVGEEQQLRSAPVPTRCGPSSRHPCAGGTQPDGGPSVDAAPQRGRSPRGPPSSREAPVAPMSLLRVDENTKRLIQGRLRLRKPGLRFCLGSLSRSPTGNLVSGPAHRGPGSDRLPLPPTSQACVGEAGTRRAIPETRLPEPWARRCRVTLLGGGRANPWMHTTGKGEKATTMDVPCARICVFCPDHSTRAQKRRGRGGVGVGSQAASSPPTHGAGAREFVRPAGHCQTSHTRDVLKLRGLRYREGVSLETVSA